jgi:hypothetical protein
MNSLVLSSALIFFSLFTQTGNQTQNKVTLPGGIQIGITEQELRQYVSNNPQKFYINDNQQYKFLHTKLDGVDYTIGIRTYKGKVNFVTYLSPGIFKNIDDSGFKLHYQKVYELVKGLNTYGRIDNVYFKKTKADWPFSMGSELDIPITHLFMSKAWICDFITIKIDEDEGKYGLVISYISTIMDTDETLWKDIYFD